MGGGDCEREPNETGCAYPCETSGGRRRCGAARRPGSSYCAPHHALCHITVGSALEAQRLREIEALAGAVGGRQTPRVGQPSPGFLDRLERLIRVFL